MGKGSEEREGKEMERREWEKRERDNTLIPIIGV